jgi:NAD+ synthase (glutamine-hydrolysing)
MGIEAVMKIILHQTHHTIGDFLKIETTIKETVAIFQKQKNASSKGREKEKANHEASSELHIFPEMFLTGYPLQDLCLQKYFIDQYLNMFKNLNVFFLEQELGDDDLCLLVGGLAYEKGLESAVTAIGNVIYQWRPGQKGEEVYRKQLLPNYDIFDEQKYFTAGNKSGLWSWREKTFGLMICEDMWMSARYTLDPVEKLEADLAALNATANSKVKSKDKNTAIKLSGLINFSASPFYLDKHAQRLARASSLSIRFKAPFFYANCVGGEDGILFDGRSLIVEGNKLVAEAAIFKADLLGWRLSETGEADYVQEHPATSPHFAPLPYFTPQLEGKKLPKLPVLSDEDCREIIAALSFGMREYATKNGFKNFTIALSGGLDSAIVTALASLTFGNDKVEAIYMPSQFSAELSSNLSAELCQQLGLKIKYFPIKFLHSICRKSFEDVFGDSFQGLADENIQSRLRGLLLYGRSNQTRSMVFNTSNKSEIAVGYSTLYGDSVGAISVLGDLYKTEIYQLAKYMNVEYKGIIPDGIISRPPSAELREGQTDEASLPPYHRLDAMLEGLLSYQLSPADLMALGFSEEEVSKVIKLYLGSEFKRQQFCPIIKIKGKSFGFGYRVPVSKKGHS